MSEQKPDYQTSNDEQLLIIARKIQTNQEQTDWFDLDEHDHEFYLDQVKSIFAALQDETVQETIAKQLFVSEQGIITKWESVAWNVKNTYKRAVATVIDHLLQTQTFNIDEYEQRIQAEKDYNQRERQEAIRDTKGGVD